MQVANAVATRDHLLPSSNMKYLALAGGSLSLAALAFGTLSASPSPSREAMPMFEITVTNLTRNQPFSPLLAASHNANAAFFVLGQPASSELAELAEDGNNAPLSDLLTSLSDVADVSSGAAPIGPGGTDTILVTAATDARLLSVASMLVNTNDAFLALDSIDLPRHGTRRYLVPAYDSGTETNNELCSFIPGPACGSAGVRDTAGAEGYVHVHAGIHGIGDLPAERYDWRNPVAEITVTRVR